MRQSRSAVFLVRSPTSTAYPDRRRAPGSGFAGEAGGGLTASKPTRPLIQRIDGIFQRLHEGGQPRFRLLEHASVDV